MDIYEKINAEYEKIRRQNEQEHKKFMDKLYSASPRIKEIDDKCAEICLEYCRRVAQSEISGEAATTQMNKLVSELLNEKESLLKKMGLSSSSLERTYNCEKCKDKGYYNGTRCSCYYAMLTSELLAASNISLEARHTFEDFDLSQYSAVEDKKYGFSPRDNASSVKEIAQYFAEEKANAPQNLFLYGATGLGKTFTSDCIARRFTDRRKSVFYISAPNLFSTFEDYKFGRNTGDITQNVISSVENCELLIIDDLGAEFHSPFVDSCLFEIINNRLAKKRKMIISSNLSPRELSKTYSDRIASRIVGEFEQLLLIGDDIRVKRLYE